MIRVFHLFLSITWFLFLLSMIGCEDDVVSTSQTQRSCETIECPLGEMCSTDSLGNVYCAPVVQLSPGGSSNSSPQGGMMNPIPSWGGEESNNEGGTSMSGGISMIGGQMNGGEMNSNTGGMRPNEGGVNG